MVRRGRLPFKEGDWFAVPLRDGCWAVGRVARMPPPPKRGIHLLGCFFGPRRDRVPVLDDVADLTPKAAISIERFIDLGLVRGTWPVLGGAGPAWAKVRDDWPMPAFGTHFRDHLPPLWIAALGELALVKERRPIVSTHPAREAAPRRVFQSRGPRCRGAAGPGQDCCTPPSARSAVKG